MITKLTLSLLLMGALLIAPLTARAHTVVWKGNEDGRQPSQPLLFTYVVPLAINEVISVNPATGEDCTVVVTLQSVQNPTLIQAQVVNSPGQAVRIEVTVLRAPLAGMETALVTAEWHATGLKGNGIPDPLNCDAINPHPFSVVVRVSEPISSGQQPNTVTAGDPISTWTGEMIGAAMDLSLGGPLPLQFGRYYASRLGSSGVRSALGANWMHTFDQSASISNERVLVTLYQGVVLQFTQANGVWQFAGPARSNYQLIRSGDNYLLADPVNGLIYTFASSGRLTRIQDRNENTLTVVPGPFGPLSVSDGLGRSLSFEYAADQQLSSVQDQTGRRITFVHSGANLVGATNADGHATRYFYRSGTEPGLLSSRMLPAGNSPWNQTFDSSGRITQQTDSFGKATSIAFDRPSAGQRTVLDPLGSATIHSYNSSGSLTEFKDAAGQSAFLAYDAASRLSSIIDRLGNQSTMGYDPVSGLLASATNALGYSTTYRYAEQTQGPFTYYNLTRIEYADGTSATFTYDSAGNILGLTDPGGRQWRYTYNSRGQVLTTRNPAGGVIAMSYNDDGTLATVTSPAGDVTTYGYDSNKRLSRITFADDTSRSFTYDALDHPLTATDERGKVTAFKYDINGNLASLTDPLGRTATTHLDSNERVTETTDPLGKKTTYQYTENGLIAVVTNGAGEKSSYSYDVLDRLKSVTDLSGSSLSFTYDKEGHLSSTTDPLGNTVTFAVDKVGRITRVTTPRGKNYDRVFNSVGRVSSISNPLSEVTKFAYDAGGFLTNCSGPGAINATYVRDALGLVASITDPNGNTWNRGHDSAGRITSDNDPLGRTNLYSYDSRNRVNRITTPAGSVEVTYDAAGNRSQVLYSDGTLKTFTYDDNNRPTGGTGVAIAYNAAGQITSCNGLTVERDSAGRIAAITYAPGKTVAYTYDARGLPARITDWAGGSVLLSYDAAARVGSLARGNGLTTQFVYDGDGRVESIYEDRGQTTFASIALERDGAGRIISATRNGPLTTAPIPGALGLSYDAAHQIVGASYDRLGRITQDSHRTYTWNQASELVGYSGADGSASFTYDAFGMRIARVPANAAVQGYVLNYALGLPSVATVKLGSADQRYYVYLPSGQLLYSIEAVDGAHRYYHFDEMGSTLFLTGDSGTVTDTYGIAPYGQIVTHLGTTDNPFTFQGAFGVMQEGATGLSYMRRRYYDSASARFLSRDPVHALDPRALNPYQYARGNPLTYTDPVGQCEFDPQTGVWIPCSGNGSPLYGRYVGPGNVGGTPIDDLDAAAWLHDDDYSKLNLDGPLDAIFGASGWWADLKLVGRSLCAVNMGFTEESGVGHFFYGWALSKLGIPIFFGAEGLVKAGVTGVVTVGEPIVEGVAAMPGIVSKAVTDLANSDPPGFGSSPVETLTKAINGLTDSANPPSTGSMPSPVDTIKKALSGPSPSTAFSAPNPVDTLKKALSGPNVAETFSAPNPIDTLKKALGFRD